VFVGAVVAVVVAIVLAWTLSDAPPRPRLVPTTATPPASTNAAATIVVRTVYRPSSVPAGFELVGERGGPAGQVAGPTASEAPVPVGDAYLLHYERARGDGPADSLDVLTVEQPDDDDGGDDGGGTATSARATAAQTTVVQVHGHQALEVQTTLPGPVRTLSWDESPGLHLRVAATGRITTDELHRVAESLAPD
jgi:hypothetical protein